MPAPHAWHVVHCLFAVDVQLAVLYSPAAQATEHDWHSLFCYIVQALDSYWPGPHAALHAVHAKDCVLVQFKFVQLTPKTHVGHGMQFVSAVDVQLPSRYSVAAQALQVEHVPGDDSNLVLMAGMAAQLMQPTSLMPLVFEVMVQAGTYPAPH